MVHDVVSEDKYGMELLTLLSKVEQVNNNLFLNTHMNENNLKSSWMNGMRMS